MLDFLGLSVAATLMMLIVESGAALVADADARLLAITDPVIQSVTCP
jgi:hypothetical protein